MASPTQCQATCAILIAALALAASANAALITDADGKPVRRTMVAPGRMAPSEAHSLLLGALDSVGVGGGLFGKLLSIVAQDTAVTPRADPDPYVTVLVRLEDLAPDEQRRLLEWQNGGGGGHGDVFRPRSIVITDRRSTIELMLGRPIN